MQRGGRLYARRDLKARAFARFPHTAMSHHRRDRLRALSMNAQRHVSERQAFNRGHEPPNPFYEYHEIADIGGLPGLLGL